MEDETVYFYSHPFLTIIFNFYFYFIIKNNNIIGFTFYFPPSELLLAAPSVCEERGEGGDIIIQERGCWARDDALFVCLRLT